MKKTILICGLLLAFQGNSLLAQTVTHKVKPGKGLYEIVYSSSDNVIYVAGIGARGEEGGGRIYRVNPDNMEVMNSIEVAEEPAFGLGINNATQTLYTSNTRNGSVHAIDIQSGTIIATITAAKEKPHTREVVVDESTNTIYVSDVGGSVWVIDGQSNTFSYEIENIGSPAGIAIDKDNKRLFIIDIKKDQVFSYDISQKAVTDSFKAGGEGAINLVYDKNADRLFIANQKSDNVTVLDAGSGKLLKTIPTGKGCLGINFCSANNRIYTANRGDGTVSIIDAGTYTVIKKLETGGTHPNTVALNNDGVAFVTNKAKSGPRPQPGEKPQPVPEDPNGDIVVRIAD